MKVLFPMAEYVASFDFTNWLVENKSRYGMTHVVFDPRNPRTNKWEPWRVWQRMTTILIPAALIGRCEVSFGTEGRRTAPPYMTGFVEWWRSGGRFDRLKTLVEPGRERYTVTLRKTQRSPERDSDEHIWREFAKRIGARVLPDYEDQPISLVERFALYAGAKMNYGICNGPMFMLTLSEYPVAMWAASDSYGMHRKAKLIDGEPYPWALPHHHLIEKRPNVDDLLKWHGDRF